MGLVKQAIQYDVKNFWEENPQLVYMSPYSKLHATDNGNEKSSKDMWCIFFMADPDEEENLFYRIPENERADMLRETFHSDFDTEDELISECIQQYPILCLTAIERALKGEKDALAKRAKFLQEAEYDFTTMKDLDNAYSKTSKIYEAFEAIEEKFMKHKTQSKVKGGRAESASEKGLI